MDQKAKFMLDAAPEQDDAISLWISLIPQAHLPTVSQH